LKTARLQRFVQQYGRRAQKGVEPNDRRYQRKTQGAVKRMKPAELDEILREDEK
jgi:ribosomal protein S18